MDNNSCNPFHRGSSIKHLHTIQQAIPWKNALHELQNGSHLKVPSTCQCDRGDKHQSKDWSTLFAADSTD